MALTEHIPQDIHALKRASYLWWWDRPARTQHPEKKPGSYVRPPCGSVTMHMVADEMCAKYGVTLAQLRERGRRLEQISHARQEFMALAYELPHTTYLMIARFLGLTDHSSVMFGRREHLKRLARDA